MSKLLIACLALAALSVCVESKFYPKNFDVRFNWLNCTYSIYNEVCFSTFFYFQPSTLKTLGSLRRKLGYHPC